MESVSFEKKLIVELLRWKKVLGITESNLCESYSLELTNREGEELKKSNFTNKKTSFEKAQRIIRGKTNPQDLTSQKCISILKSAIILQAKSVEGKECPKSFTNTNKRKEAYVESQRKKSKLIRDKFTSRESEIVAWFKTISMLYKPQMISAPLNQEEKKAALESCKGMFCNYLSLKQAYVLSENIQAFMIFLNKDIFEFYSCIQRMNEKSKKDLEANICNLNVQLTVNNIVQISSNSSLQEWLRIRKGFYIKTIEKQLKKDTKAAKLKRGEYIAEIRESRKIDKEMSEYLIKKAPEKKYFQEKILHDQCWEKFVKEMMKISFPISTPLLVITQTDILNNILDIDLLIRFLYCPPSGQKKILLNIEATDKAF